MLPGLGQAHPSICFPQFSGENPKLWKTMCEQYFAMFTIHTSFWVPMAALNFTGSASVWLQSIQRKLSEYEWESFTALLCTRFGRDRHQLLILQFYTIRQTSSVSDYIERFELIINHLASYSDTIHPYYYLTHFVEGLRADIRVVVLIQRPPDLDRACSLTLLQEEVAEGVHRPRSPPPTQHAADATLRPGVPMPLPPPPARPTPLPAPTAAVDRRGIDAARADSSKVKALREYRRARGLCFKCGERWGHDHTCPTTVQLHVVEELLELFGIDAVFDAEQQQATEPVYDTVMAISRQALTGGVSPKAFQLHACIQGREILMLVDSGSSTSFVDEQLAAQLAGTVPLQTLGRVRVAGGGELLCTSVIPHCSWFSQGHEFKTDMKVLPLGTYDAILGMDWLEDNSPMTVDWRAKRIELRVNGNTVCLEGHPSTTTCSVISNAQLHSLCCQGPFQIWCTYIKWSCRMRNRQQLLLQSKRWLTSLWISSGNPPVYLLGASVTTTFN